MIERRTALRVRSADRNQGLRPPGPSGMGEFDPSQFHNYRLPTHPTGLVLKRLRAANGWWPIDAFTSGTVTNYGSGDLGALTLTGMTRQESNNEVSIFANGASQFAVSDQGVDVGSEDDLFAWAVIRFNLNPPSGNVGIIGRGDGTHTNFWGLRFGNAERTAVGVVKVGSTTLSTTPMPWRLSEKAFIAIRLNRHLQTLDVYSDGFWSEKVEAAVGAVTSTAPVRIMRNSAGYGAGEVLDAGVIVGPSLAPTDYEVELVKRTVVDRSDRYLHGMYWISTGSDVFNGIEVEPGQALYVKSRSASTDYLTPLGFGDSFMVRDFGTVYEVSNFLSHGGTP